MKPTVKIEEYEQLCEQMKCDTEIRNNLLTFSFTAVLTVIGIGFAMEPDEVNPIIFLLPFFIIIPFAGRMSYYRIWSAHIKAYLCVYAKELNTYTDNAKKVPIERGVIGKILAVLVNYEMFFLACATSLLFFSKYPVEFENFSVKDWCICSIPVILTAIVFVLITTVFNYKNIRSDYEKEWGKI